MLIDKDLTLLQKAYNKVNESLHGRLTGEYERRGILDKNGYSRTVELTQGEEELLNYLDGLNEERDREEKEARAAGREVYMSRYPADYPYLKQIGATEEQLNQSWNDIRRGERRAEPWEVSLTGDRQPTPLEYYKSYSDVNDQMADEKERRKNPYGE